jgi:capsular exopolysaccharide synthesis family protein
VEPKDFGRIILRRKRTVVTAIIVVMLTTLFGSMRKQPTFVGNCEVLFGVVLSDPTDPKSEAIGEIGDINTNIHFVAGPEVRAAAAKLLNTDAGALGAVDAKIVPNTQYINITVAKGRGAPDAGAVCNAVANSYIGYKKDVAREFFKKAALDKQRDLNATYAELTDATNRLDGAHSTTERLAAQVAIDGIIKDANDIQTKIRAFRNQLVNGVDGGSKLSAPSAGGVPQGANHKRDLLLGMIVGLMFGIAIAIVREYLDDTVRDKESTQRDLGLPVLANLPATDGSMEGFVDTGASTVEAARQLRATLGSMGFPEEKSMLVIASTMGKARSTTLVALAAAVAESGKSVLVIGSDMRNGRTHEGFGIANSVGLANVVRGQVPFERAIRPAPGLEGVYVLPCGPIIGNPGELLSSEEMAFTLRKARRWADVVLLDAPPVLTAADASILGAYSDGVVLVMVSGSTNRVQANEAKEQLVAAGARVLGAVLIGSEESGARASNTAYGNDDLPPMMPFSEWGGFTGGGEADWYGDDMVTATVRTAPRSGGARRNAPSKKTAAASVKRSPSARTSRAGSASRQAPARKTAATRNGTARKPAGSGSAASARKAAAGTTAARRKTTSPMRVQTTAAKRRSAAQQRVTQRYW